MKTVEDIEFKISLCTECDLYKEAINEVPGIVIPDSDICVVGEAPGNMEDVKGIPFVGESGQKLRSKMREHGFADGEYSILNTVKHRPPNNRQPEEEEIFWCFDFLKAQLRIIKPKYVLCFGKVATWTILIKKRPDFSTPKISYTGNVRSYFDKIHEVSIGDLKFKAIVFYHPAYWLRNPKCLSYVDSQFELLKRDINGSNT